MKKNLIILILGIFIFLGTTSLALAADYEMKIGIPNGRSSYNFSGGMAIADLIEDIYNYAIGIVGLLSAMVIMYAGFKWLTAGGSPDKVNEAKAWIASSLTGLVLTIFAYSILNFINPVLVTKKSISLPVVKPEPIDITVETTSGIGCCEFNDVAGHDCTNYTETKCKNLDGKFMGSTYNCEANSCIYKGECYRKTNGVQCDYYDDGGGGYCVGGICIQLQETGEKCTMDYECAVKRCAFANWNSKNYCTTGELGAFCADDEHCLSEKCDNNKCIQKIIIKCDPTDSDCTEKCNSGELGSCNAEGVCECTVM